MLLLSQNPQQTRTLSKSLALLELGTHDVFQDIPTADLPRLAKFFIDALPEMDPTLVTILETGALLDDDTRERIKALWHAFMRR
jgi:F0F1-type ATP synthase alpha subunit